MSFDRHLLRFPRQFFSTLNVVRVPLAVAILASLALYVPPQTHEIYRILAQDIQTDWAQIFASYVSLFLAGWILWRTAYYLTKALPADSPSGQPVESKTRRWLPRLIGTAPIVACGFGILHAQQGLLYAAVHAGDVLESLGGDFRVEELKTLKTKLEADSEILQIGALICFVLAALLILSALLRARDETTKHPSPLSSLFGSEPRFVSYALVLAITIMFSLAVVAVPQALGTLTIFNVFVVCLVLFLTLLDVLGRRSGIPFITIGLIVAVVASVFELNNNHGIRTWERTEAFEKPQVVQAFDAWYRSRKDRQFYEQRNQPYPVYIVAARGGGLYAAYHTAKFLARLQDQCPSFAQHTFAISGVSGGSLGGAVFAALTKALKAPNDAHLPCTALNEPRNQDFEERVDEFFDSDFLSPLLAALLFPDFVQHVLPYPIPSFDRAQTLEASIEKTWAHVAPEDPGIFSDDVFSLWAPAGSTPALVLNTTNVETGINHAVMPFMSMDQARVPLFDVLRPEAGREETPGRAGEPQTPGPRYRETMALSTAAVLSARFPWVLPAGSHDALSFVDGGYYDNSGLSAAEDIIAILRPRFKDVDFIVISFFDWIEFGERFTELYKERPARIDLTAPISAMLSVRETRIGDTFLRLAGRPDFPGFEQLPDGSEVNPARLVALDASDWQLPLVWQLSRLTRNLIGIYSGAPLACRLHGASRDEHDADVLQLNYSDCTACRVYRELSGNFRSEKGENVKPCSTPSTQPQ
ncbi:MAG TPA: hypothetical protein VMW68_01710 [Methyloceanibacter sp.]|nr:hypothetical protein [Methyloceanibacter sp.]